MKLQRLVGYGPIAAFVTAASLLVYAGIDQFGGVIVQSAPGFYQTMAIVYFIAVPLWAAALAVVVFDLEWIEHPKTSTRWLNVARGATLVALVMPLVADISVILKAGITAQPPIYLLLYGGVGISLLIHNIEGRRARLLHGVLPWLGAAIGAAYIVAGIGFGLFLVPGIGMTAYMVGFNVLLLGQVLYIVWAIWMGVRLSRSKPAMVAAAA